MTARVAIRHAVSSLKRWDVGRPKSRIDRQNIVVYNIDVLKRKYKNKYKKLKGQNTMTNSTYVTFKERLNRYFNSTNGNDIMILTEITGGVVYPAMSEEEIKVVYELMKWRYFNIKVDYLLSKAFKEDNLSAWREVCNKIPQTEKIESNFYYAILFNDTDFYE